MGQNVTRPVAFIITRRIVQSAFVKCSGIEQQNWRVPFSLCRKWVHKHMKICLLKGGWCQTVLSSLEWLLVSLTVSSLLLIPLHCTNTVTTTRSQEYSGPFALVRLLNISLFHFAPIYQTHSNIECQQQNVNLYRCTQWSCSAAPLSPLSNRDTFLDLEHSFLRRQKGRFGRHKFYAAAIKKIMFSFPGEREREREIDDRITTSNVR